VKRGEFGDTTKKRAIRLIRWHRTFGAEVKPTDKKFQPLHVVREMIDEIYDSGQAVSNAFRAYCKTDGAAETIFQMRKAMEDAGKGKLTTYNVIHFMYQNQFDFKKLTPENIVNLFKMALKAPPLTRFAGHTMWGSGNHDSPEDNKKKHFYKHVLDAHPTEQLTWHDECGRWWKALGIEYTRKQARADLPFFARVSALFPADDDTPLAADKAPDLVIQARTNGGWGNAALNRLHNGWGAAYADMALALSRDMKHMIVHTEPRKAYAVFLKGINGDFFIGGRIEDEELTISTCFIPRPDVNKKTLNEDKLIWRVTTD
jgi:hypothetical protein